MQSKVPNDYFSLGFQLDDRGLISYFVISPGVYIVVGRIFVPLWSVDVNSRSLNLGKCSAASDWGEHLQNG